MKIRTWFAGDSGNRIWQNIISTVVLLVPWIIIATVFSSQTYQDDLYFAFLGLYFSLALTGWYHFYLRQRERKYFNFLESKHSICREFNKLIEKDDAQIILGSNFKSLVENSGGLIPAASVNHGRIPIYRLVTQRQNCDWKQFTKDLLDANQRSSIVMDFDESVCVFSKETGLIIEMNDDDGKLRALKSNHAGITSLLQRIRVDSHGRNHFLSSPFDADRYLRSVAESFQNLYMSQVSRIRSDDFPIAGDHAVLSIYKNLMEECTKSFYALDALSLTNYIARGSWSDIYNQSYELFGGQGTKQLQRIVSVPKYRLESHGAPDQEKIDALKEVDNFHKSKKIEIKYMAADMSVFNDWRNDFSGFIIVDDQIVMRTQDTRMNPWGVGGVVKKEPQMVFSHKDHFLHLFNNELKEARVFDSPVELLSFYGVQ